MIAKLRGKIALVEGSEIIVDISGVGYKVYISEETKGEIKGKKEIELWTYLAVRETALDLYGFIQKEELNFFEMLIGVSGIGPKSALAVLALASVDVLEKAISSNDSSYLTKVSGIGKKSAEKIILELRDKIGTRGEGSETMLKEEAEALEALKALGYTLGQAREALKKVNVEITGTNDRIKEALKILGQ
jgi:Holliday junction DNA helicase RuvA